MPNFSNEELKDIENWSNTMRRSLEKTGIFSPEKAKEIIMDYEFEKDDGRKMKIRDIYKLLGK